MGSGNMAGSSTKADRREKVNGRIQVLKRHTGVSPLECLEPGCGLIPALNFLVSFQQNPVIPPVVYPNPTYVSACSGRVGVFFVLGRVGGEGQLGKFKAVLILVN